MEQLYYSLAVSTAPITAVDLLPTNVIKDFVFFNWLRFDQITASDFSETAWKGQTGTRWNVKPWRELRLSRGLRNTFSGHFCMACWAFCTHFHGLHRWKVLRGWGIGGDEGGSRTQIRRFVVRPPFWLDESNPVLPKQCLSEWVEASTSQCQSSSNELLLLCMWSQVLGFLFSCQRRFPRTLCRCFR